MTLEEALSKIAEQNEKIKELTENNKSLEIIKDDNSKKFTDLEKQLEETRKRNMELFLRIPQEVTPQPTPTPTPKPQPTLTCEDLLKLKEDK